MLILKCVAFIAIMAGGVVPLVAADPPTYIPLDPSIDATFAHLGLHRVSFELQQPTAPESYQYYIEVYEEGTLISTTDKGSLIRPIGNPQGLTSLQFDIVYSRSPDRKGYTVTVKHPHGLSHYPNIEFEGGSFFQDTHASDTGYTLPFDAEGRFVLTSEFPDGTRGKPPSPTTANSKKALVFRIQQNFSESQ